MPIPAFIICSRSGSIDQLTGAVSCFDVMHALQIHKATDDQIPMVLKLRNFAARAVAGWIRDESDSVDTHYESEFVAILPGAEKEHVLVKYDDFMLPTQMHILVLPEFNISVFPGPGIATIENRLRRKGETEWTASQRHSFVLEEAQPLADLIKELEAKAAGKVAPDDKSKATSIDA